MIRAQDIPQGTRDYVARQRAERPAPAMSDATAAALVRLLGPTARRLADAGAPDASEGARPARLPLRD